MIKLGKMQKMEVVRKSQEGLYLKSKQNKSNEEILLPRKEVIKQFNIGDEIEVFVYRDSEDKMISTLKRPKLTLGEVALLKVVDNTKYGAFLDWGLDKDLLMPAKEQVGKIRKDSAYLVGLYINNRNRLCATMKVYELLEPGAPYKENDKVKGTVYSINLELGVFVAVDNKYHGMIPKNELYREYAIGDQVELRVKKVRQDGKLELSGRQEAHNEIESDAQRILNRLKLNGGFLRVNDESTPAKIKAELNMSKRAFKRAVGRLLKEGAIKITDEGIKMTW